MATIYGYLDGDGYQVEQLDDDVTEAACTELKEAMDGLGTNEAAIISVLCRFSNAQRRQLEPRYKQMWGKGLLDELKDELGGNFEAAVVCMMTEPSLYDAQQLRAAIKGAGTDEATLIEILCARDNDEIEAIKAAYATLDDDAGYDLEKDIEDDCSGYFRRLLVSLVNAAREDEPARVWRWVDELSDEDEAQAVADVEALLAAGPDQLGTDESEIARVLCTRSPLQLRRTFELYKEMDGEGKEIEQALAAELSGALEDGFISLVTYIRSPTLYFAKKIKAAIEGVGTNDESLIRIVIGRSEKDLAHIKHSYLTMTMGEDGEEGETLQKAIKNDCSGDYKRLLIRVQQGDDDDYEEE